jgi:carbamoyltransferase
MMDTKPYIQYDPIIGYRYIPDTQMTLRHPGGGTYTITVNSAGIRSDREYTLRKPPGIFRILVFGDSMAAGQYVSDEHRFSEVLEQRLPRVEVINFGLEGTGTDQQLLLFEHLGQSYEFDVIVLLPFLQNIRRNMADFRISLEPETGKPVLTPKPRFELVNGNLVLRNVPVPTERKPVSEAGAGSLARTDTDVSRKAALKTWLSRVAEALHLKKVVYALVPWEPFPEYKSPSTPAWRLMEAIIRRFKLSAGEKPLVIVPLFYSSYLRYRMARNYWQRFASLAGEKGIYVLDVLPHFKRLGSDVSRCFLEPSDCHLSVHGHLALADALEVELTRLGLFPKATHEQRTALG